VKIEKSMRNEVSAAAVYEMLCTKEFQEQKCIDAGALSYDVTITPGADGTVVIKTKRKLPTVGFPSLLKRFVPSGVTSTETVEWGHPEDGGTRSGALRVDFHGAPASMSGVIRIVPDGANVTTVVVDATFTAHVPLVGRKVEGFASPIIMSVIDAEEGTAKAWVAARE
jgi:hypothetical protein